MKKNQFLKLFILLLTIPVFIIIATSGGGGGKDGTPKDGKGPDINGNTNIPTEYKNAVLVLDHIGAPSMPSTRKDAFFAAAHPNLWSGSQSATSLYDSPSAKYYCKISVAASTGEIKEYTWKSDNNRDNRMTISVPSNKTFKLTVEYWEQCGNFWKDVDYSRGFWLYEATINYSSTIQAGGLSWLFIRKEKC